MYILVGMYKGCMSTPNIDDVPCSETCVDVLSYKVLVVLVSSSVWYLSLLLLSPC